MMRKKIIDSWDKIKPSSATHERILSNVLRKAYQEQIAQGMSKERSNIMTSGLLWKICGPLVACILVVLIVAIPFLLQNPRNGDVENQDTTYDIAQDTTDDDQQEMTVASPIQPENIASDTAHALVINETSEMMPETRRLWELDRRQLTNDALNMILPNYNGDLSAYAYFNTDGSLLEISVFESIVTDSIGSFTSIIISSEKTFPTFVYDFEPIVSYVYEVPVIVGMIVNHYDDYTAAFSAVFELGGVHYRIFLTDYTEGEQGPNRLAATIETIITNGPADMSVVDESSTTPFSPTYELVLNSETGRASLSPGRMPPGMSFAQTLTARDAAAVQPGLNNQFELQAIYLYNGEFIQLLATERNFVIGMTQVRDANQLATISITQSSGYPLDILHDTEPNISYVYSVPVIAGTFWLAHHYCDEGRQLYNFNAIFELGNYLYRIDLLDSHEGDRGYDRLNEIVHMIIRSGPADHTNLPEVVIPELLNQPLTQEEAFHDQDFGIYMPSYVPSGLEFVGALRIVDQLNNYLSSNWHEIGAASISWVVNTSHPLWYDQIVSVNDREKFDVNLYTIPWMDSVPNDIIDYLSSPVFLAQEMSLDIVQARTLYSGRNGTLNPSINFNVMFDGIIIQIGSLGVTAEEIWRMIESVLN